jgi:Glycosyl transferase family 8
MSDEVDAARETEQAGGDTVGLSVRKWYFATNLNGLQHAFDQIKVAVTSARTKTALRPYCLVDDHEDLAEVASRLSWLERRGVTLIRRKAELFGIVSQHFGPAANVFSGHWLRCDIPLVETEERVVLYTDIDIMFRRDLNFSEAFPPVLACSPEHRQDDFSYFNSGVMLMNVRALRESRDLLTQVVKDRLDSMQPHDDQGALNVAYRNAWTKLPNLYNWKPYWGVNDEVAIVHFHGPKPGLVRRMLEGEVDIYCPEDVEIFRRNPDGYRMYLAEFDDVLNTDIS